MKSEKLIRNIKKKKIICFGASLAAKKLLDSVPLLEIEFFIDNDKDKLGQLFLARPICSPKILMGIDTEDYFVIITSQYLEEIKVQLEELGLKENNYCSYIDVRNSLNSNMTFENGHYYSPIPNMIEVEEKEEQLFSKNKKVTGVKLNEDDQHKLLQQFMPLLTEFYQLLKEEQLKRYYVNNGFFEFFDASTLYSFLSHFKPKRIIEVGSGYSSAIMLDARDQLKLDTSMTFIEPFPERLNKLLTESDKKDTKIIISKVQEVPLNVFQQLEAGDILFIDSSHVAKIGSDVNYLLFEVIPHLREGVLIHFHDIFYPFEYPKEWIYKGYYWNEAYILRSFLQYNDTFKTLYWNDYIYRTYLNSLPEEFLDLKGSFGGGYWIEKTT